MLAIQGAPGEGKSYQAREALARIGAYVVPISGAAISGPHEGDAVNVLLSAYRFASALRVDDRRLAVLLIDDFDLSVAATRENRTYTVNSQLVTGTLMNLADDPIHYATKYARVPIILTGNNFQDLHLPLTRHGRMTFFEWMPNEKERLQVIQAMLANLLPRREQARLGEFLMFVRDEPLSFVSAIKDDLINRLIVEHARQGRMQFEVLESAITEMLTRVSVDDLMELATLRKKGQQTQDYIPRRRSWWSPRER
jgi:hypothetical protein